MSGPRAPPGVRALRSLYARRARTRTRAGPGEFDVTTVRSTPPLKTASMSPAIPGTHSAPAISGRVVLPTAVHFRRPNGSNCRVFLGSPQTP